MTEGSSISKNLRKAGIDKTSYILHVTTITGVGRMSALLNQSGVSSDNDSTSDNSDTIPYILHITLQV